MTGTPASLETAVEDTLRAGLDDGVYLGAGAAVGDSEGVTTLATVGHETADAIDPTTRATRFDVASLTKPIVTATITHRLAERGKFDLEATLGDYVDAAAGTARGEIPIRTLLTHTSGLAPYKSFPFGWEGTDALLHSLYESPLSPLAAPGHLFVYSDLNFVHLADALRHATGESLAELASKHVFEPVGMDEAYLGPLETDANLAATADEHWRERHLRGEINDYIAAVMNGESGNAGLFVTVPDLAAFACSMLDGGRVSDGRLLAPATVDTLQSNAIPHLDRPYGLGWQLAHAGQPAPTWSDAAFGHTGYTGCSLWIDPERTQFAVLCTNRLLTDVTADEMDAFRRRFHGAIAGASDMP